MHEIVINLHMHTPYSDGTGMHEEIAQAAMKANLDAVIVTDHNILVKGPQGYYQNGAHKVLLLTGEEIHDTTRTPQKNHLLVFGAGRELASQAGDPQTLLDAVHKAGGLAFIAHPDDPAAPAVGQSDISWVDWGVQGYTGIELWNGFSEFKSRIKSKLHAIFYAFFPWLIAQGPLPQTLKHWDELLAAGQRVAAVGGSDAHALHLNLGPIRRTVFPYEFHFRSVNTHLYLREKLNGDPKEDGNRILEALKLGRAFIGYDLPASTRGFRFTAKGDGEMVYPGASLEVNHGVTMQIRLPYAAECRLIKDGRTVKTWKQQTILTHITNQPGVYRVEAYLDYLGSRRGWIYSNPIYLKGDH
jgi:hypothetical protein